MKNKGGKICNEDQNQKDTASYITGDYTSRRDMGKLTA